MKKKLSFFVPSIVGLLFVGHNALAECTLNGEVIPCDQMPRWPFVFMIFFFLFMMFFLAFWIWMIVDVVRNEKNNDLAIWILVIVLLGIIGAIVYYFARRRPRIKATKNEQMQQQETPPQTDNK